MITLEGLVRTTAACLTINYNPCIITYAGVIKPPSLGLHSLHQSAESGRMVSCSRGQHDARFSPSQYRILTRRWSIQHPSAYQLCKIHPLASRVLRDAETRFDVIARDV